MEEMLTSINISRHEGYLRRYLSILPTQYISMDAFRLTALYFCVAGIDICNGTQEPTDIENIVGFIMKLNLGSTGFLGSFCFPYNKHGQIAMTFSAISSLLTLGGESYLTKIDRKAIAADLKLFQNHNDGSFSASCVPGESESDMRFVYCACCIAAILDDWSGADWIKAYKFILNCQTYEGGFGLKPGNEAVGGATYCAIASLVMLRDSRSGPDHFTFPRDRWETAVAWCQARQVVGFQGRANKQPDTCYAFWIGAGLLGALETKEEGISSSQKVNPFRDIDIERTTSFLLHSCQPGCAPSPQSPPGVRGYCQEVSDSHNSRSSSNTLRRESMTGSKPHHEAEVESIDQRIRSGGQLSGEGVKEGAPAEYLGGGFSKLPDEYPDLLHTFYSLCWLSMASTASTGADVASGGAALSSTSLRAIDLRLGVCADKVPTHLLPAVTVIS